MAFAITQTCCNDASCVSVCPVNCIHPTPDEPGFGTTEMLHVDPQTCIDCGACADACPVDAIYPVDRLRGSDTIYADINKRYYTEHPEIDNTWSAPHFPRALPRDVAPLRVAVVGTGPAAGYTARALLLSAGAEVTMIDRLPVPGGLVRSGVAPDHPATKKIGESFEVLYRHPKMRMHMNVEVGKDIRHSEIAAHHHAVVYAVGAATDRALGIPGEGKANSISATEFVAWYNGHPDVSAGAIDLSAKRAVIVGNGNVALDVARILVSDPQSLTTTDIADHALEALRTSAVREVFLLARRGPEHAAYSRPEFLALKHLPGVDVVVDDHAHVRETISRAPAGSKAALLNDLEIIKLDGGAPPPEGKRIVLRFLSSPIALGGDAHVDSVRIGTNVVREHDGVPYVDPTGEEDVLAAGLVLRSVGYRGSPIADLPFDATTATVPNEAGRVIDPDSGEAVPRTYVAGRIKRGPSGGIGANRTCAAETVETLMEDAAEHQLPAPTGSAKDFATLVRRRKPDAIGRRQMLAIEHAERQRGLDTGRPRVKFSTFADLLQAGKQRRRRS